MEEKINEKHPKRALQRYSKTIKIVTIAGLCLLLLIPMVMIKDLIRERNRTQEEAIEEVSDKWSHSQTITGPYLNFQYPATIEEDGKQRTITKNLVLFPDDLFIEGELKTEVLKRGIYEVNVYHSELTIKGSFSSKELLKSKIDISGLMNEEEIPYEVKLHLKGSESIFFVPVGKTSQIKLNADWNTPSFTGNYLPKNAM